MPMGKCPHCGKMVDMEKMERKERPAAPRPGKTGIRFGENEADNRAMEAMRQARMSAPRKGKMY